MAILQQHCLLLPSQSNGSRLSSHRPERSNLRKLHSNFVFNSHSVSQPTPDQNVAAIVFGEGSESRLYPLTKRRSEGAVPIAAKYRLVDAVVSNCIHSNISKIYALTQFNSTSLNSHLYRAHSGLVQVIAAYQSPEHDNRWFQGNADAVRRCLWLVAEDQPSVREFLLLPGYHLYKMDYRQLIDAHRNMRADITIVASSSGAITHDPGFGFLDLDSRNRVRAFRFKSEGKWIRFASSTGRKLSDLGCHSLPSMGIYVINKDVMTRLVEEHFVNADHFDTQIIPGAVSIGMKVEAYLFDGYWEDMSNIGAFYHANLEAINARPCSYNFRNLELSEVYTLARCLPPTIITDQALIIDSLIGDGCVIGRCNIKGSVIGMRTRVGDGVTIEDSVIFDSSEIYDQAEEGTQRKVKRNECNESIPMGIGQHTLIRKAIVDKNARIGKNVMIINKDKVEEGDGEAEGFVIREGIVILLPNAVVPNSTIL